MLWRGRVEGGLTDRRTMSSSIVKYVVSWTNREIGNAEHENPPGVFPRPDVAEKVRGIRGRAGRAAGESPNLTPWPRTGLTIFSLGLGHGSC
jgi:hypothetical protein